MTEERLKLIRYNFVDTLQAKRRILSEDAAFKDTCHSFGLTEDEGKEVLKFYWRDKMFWKDEPK